MGFIKPNNNSGGSGGGLTPQQESRLNNAYSHAQSNHAPLSAEENVQADWNETDETSDAYIKNKPTISNDGFNTISSTPILTLDSTTIKNNWSSSSRSFRIMGLPLLNLSYDKRYIVEFLGKKQLCSLSEGEYLACNFVEVMVSIEKHQSSSTGYNTGIIIKTPPDEEGYPTDISNMDLTDLVLYEEEVTIIDSKYLDSDLKFINSIGLGRVGTSGSNSCAIGYVVEASGTASHAEGEQNHSLGQRSHTEGLGNIAYGSNSHAEGAYAKAKGNNSHAEGYGTVSSGNNSHAEGYITTTNGNYSHAEGYRTIASSQGQHVQGQYNIEDTENKYAHIVGNGSNTARSNAHTLDWNGNAWYKGKLSQDGTPTEDKDLTTKKYVDDAVSNMSTSGGNEDSVIAYVTQNELNEAILNGTIDSSKIYKVDEKFGIEDYFYSIDPTLLQDGVYTLNSDNSITYSNTIPTESELDLSTTTAVGLIYKGCTSLTKFVANFTTTGVLNNLIFVNCDNLQRVHILNCPLASNRESLLKMIKYLPDRNNRAWGSIIIPSNKELRLELECDSIEKDWYFGSDILYKPEELAKCQDYIIDSGVIDIWESAEYGEGRRVAIADSGLITGALEIDYSRNKGYYNFSNHKGTEENPVPGDTDEPIHGNAIASVMIGKGHTWYGISPKSEWVFIKIGDEDGIERNCQSEPFKIANKTSCDVIANSYNSGEIDENIRPSYLAMNDLIDYYNSPNKGFLIRSVGNVKINKTALPFTVGSTKETMLIGGYYYDDDYGENVLFYYSATRPNVHFIEIASLEAEYGTTPGAYRNFSGTSCSEAVFAGRALLAINLYIKKYGYKPTKQELVDFLKYRTCRVKIVGVFTDIDINDTYQGYGVIDFMSYNPNPVCDNELDIEWEE